jgi:DNA processing protein
LENTTYSKREYLALWAVPGIGSITSRKLIAYAGGIKEVFSLKKRELLKIPGIGTQMAEILKNTDYFRMADEELEFAQKYNIQISSIFEDEYPARLKQCEDAPLLIFTKGKPIETQKKYVAIVGTRSATSYGKDFCNQLIESLKDRGHEAIIVSGLAYGVDITAHKAALKFGLGTIGVLAHGLDTIYPAQHRKTAAEMLQTGGLITEFMHGTFPDKNNFVRRNRIIAGLSDAVIVVESDVKGGALITAELAISYNRDVFALPGRTGDKYSSGCNNLIKSNKAALIDSIKDLEYQMGWQTNHAPVQKELFIPLSEEEKTVMNLFSDRSPLSIDEICRLSPFPMAKVSAMLLNLEFSGAVKCLPGKMFYKV